tara:strand:- start:108 stop:458 length:351 start_codon:yes stop_codon:yes gene_type:complete
MITVIETLSVYDMISSHCVMNNKCILHFENKKFHTMDDATKTACLDWLGGYAPEDIILAIKGEGKCAIEYKSEDVAILNAGEWFPPQSAAPVPDYYFRAMVFNGDANIVFENINPK